MTRLFPGDQTGNLHYEVGSDSLPGANTDYIVFGNREYYQVRGYAEVTEESKATLPVYLSGQLSNVANSKQLAILPQGAVVHASRIAMPADTLQGLGSDAGAIYAHWQTVTLAGDAFVPRVSGSVSGTSVSFAAKGVGASGSTTNFLNPLAALPAPRSLNVYSSGSTGIRCSPKDNPSQIGVEVEFSLPYSSKNISRDEIVIL